LHNKTERTFCRANVFYIIHACDSMSAWLDEAENSLSASRLKRKAIFTSREQWTSCFTIWKEQEQVLKPKRAILLEAITKRGKSVPKHQPTLLFTTEGFNKVNICSYKNINMKLNIIWTWTQENNISLHI
jgi:hypothetical protein